MSATDIDVGLLSHLTSKTIDKERGVPFRSEMLELVYGDMDYIRSVFGPGKITRDLIIDYFDNATVTWPKVDFTQGKTRLDLVRWCKSMNIKALHYYAPMGQKIIWFKEPETAFLCRLKFGL
jgi:hypothetical protein